MYLHSEFEGKINQVIDDKNGQSSIYSGKDYGLRLCKDYIGSVNLVVSRETDVWAQEFQQVLIQFEKPANQELIPFKLDRDNLNRIDNGG